MRNIIILWLVWMIKCLDIPSTKSFQSANMSQDSSYDEWPKFGEIEDNKIHNSIIRSFNPVREIRLSLFSWLIIMVDQYLSQLCILILNQKENKIGMIWIKQKFNLIFN
jgi:hypothetical protein